jgi:hypothetical protein
MRRACERRMRLGWWQRTLCLKSPSALDNDRSPFTRPSTMKPPACRIRCLSAATLGLWSRESGSGTPARHRTARESPTLATVSERCVTSNATRVVPHAHAGRPQWRKSASICRITSASCCATCHASSPSVGAWHLSACRRSRSGSSSAAQREQNLPPWPSSTAKQPKSGLSSSVTTSSSMDKRQPRSPECAAPATTAVAGSTVEPVFFVETQRLSMAPCLTQPSRARGARALKTFTASSATHPGLSRSR